MQCPMLIFAIIAAAALPLPASGAKNSGDKTKGKLKEVPIQIKETVTKAEVVAIPKNTNKVRSMLFKVTDMPNYYDHFKHDENFCSVFHHGPDCGAVQFLKLPVRGWQKAEVAIISYNKKTKDILRMYKSVAQIAGTVASSTLKMTKMERIDRQNKVIEVTEIPDIVKEKNATWVKVILPALNVVPSSDDEPTKDLRALLESTRVSELGEKKVDWNPGDTSTSELDEMLKQYEEEVDQKLLQLGIPLSTMKRVSLTFPFSPPPP